MEQKNTQNHSALNTFLDQSQAYRMAVFSPITKSSLRRFSFVSRSSLFDKIQLQAIENRSNRKVNYLYALRRMKDPKKIYIN